MYKSLSQWSELVYVQVKLCLSYPSFVAAPSQIVSCLQVYNERDYVSLLFASLFAWT